MQAKRLYSLFTLLLKRLSLALLVLFLCRIIYFAYNLDYFPSNTWAIVKSFLSGIVFDASTVAYIYAPFTILSLLPYSFQTKVWYKQTLRALFITLTALCVTANLADAIYFKFARKRSGIEVFTMLTDESNPVGNYFVTYWPWLIIIAVIVAVTAFLYVYGTPDLNKSKRKWWFYVVVGLVLALSARGSIGLKPLKTFDAARFVPAEFVPLAVNTPFNLLSTWQGSSLDKVTYFGDSTLPSILDIEKNYFEVKRPPNQPNIVIIILESFARDYCGWLRNKDLYTPFLDSLSKKSLNFTNAYANGNISIHGLPAVMASIPNFMEVPYINSSYQNNTIKNVGGLLSKINYQSHFYHGADNGTMGFQSFLKISGWQNYNGKDQYPNYKRDFDGSWGIFDGPYFKYVSEELNQKKQPFIAGMFSLTSHEPYPLPKAYEKKYKEGFLLIHPNVQYTDEMLKEFFEKSQKVPWFNNTIFIITADHTSHSKDKYFYSAAGQYEIPLLIYDPSGRYVPPQESSKTVNQIDIMPTILDLVNYPYPFFSLGTSVLDSGRGFAYQKNGGVYQIISYPYVAQMKPGGKVNFFKTYKEDNTRYYDLFPAEFEIRKTMIKRLLAFIQQHHNNMVDNTFYLDNL